MSTLVELLEALQVRLGEIKTLSAEMVAASAQQAADYEAAKTAQVAAGVSSDRVVALAQQIMEKIGAVI